MVFLPKMRLDFRRSIDWNMLSEEFPDGRFIDMIAVGMSNEDRVKVRHSQAQLSQLEGDVARSETAVDENRRVGGPDECRIACA